LQECHSQLLRHRNIYLQHVKLIIKAGGPWENLVLQGILKEGDLPLKEGMLMAIHYCNMITPLLRPYLLLIRPTEVVSTTNVISLTERYREKRRGACRQLCGAAVLIDEMMYHRLAFLSITYHSHTINPHTKGVHLLLLFIDLFNWICPAGCLGGHDNMHALDP